MIECPYCGGRVFSLAKSGDRLKAKTSMLVLHKSGDVEINCTHCKQGVLVPLVPKSGEKRLRKAAPRRMHTLKKGVDTTG